MAKYSSPAALLCLSLWTLVGCGPSLYELPAPPPADTWRAFDRQLEETEEERVRRFLAAKSAAIQAFAALQGGEFEEALGLMSQETRNFFEDSSGGRGALVVLQTGLIMVAGEESRFDPVADIFIEDLQDIRDDFGQSEAETPRRKELYAISRSGKARKIVMIFEADGWRLHSPFLKTPLLGP
jgi:hypothetical protein